MFRPVSSGFCKDEHAKILKYAYFKSLDEHAPNKRRAYLAVIAALCLSYAVVKGDDFLSALLKTGALIFGVNALYIDIQVYGTPLNFADYINDDPWQNLTLNTISFFMPNVVKDKLVTEGNKAGREAAEKWNNEEHFFQFR